MTRNCPCWSMRFARHASSKTTTERVAETKCAECSSKESRVRLASKSVTHRQTALGGPPALAMTCPGNNSLESAEFPLSRGGPRRREHARP